MDKIITTSVESQELFKWKEEHRDLLYRKPNPLPAVEIVISDINVSFKCIRETNNQGDFLTIRINFQGKSYGYIKFKYMSDSVYMEVVKKTFKGIEIIDLPYKEQINDILTTYTTYMAFITYGALTNQDNFTEEECDILEEVCDEKVKQVRQYNSIKKKPKQNITFIIKKNSKGERYLVPQNSHRSPTGIFSVRGHFRHYQNGNTIWIDAYKKGLNNKKTKNKKYKLGI